jgi:hypothetical protein
LPSIVIAFSPLAARDDDLPEPACQPAAAVQPVESNACSGWPSSNMT